MKRAKYITRCLAISVAVVALSLPFLAQKNDYHPPVARAQAPSRPAPSPGPHNQAPARQPERHVGDWLRQHKDLPPGEQERALQNDPHFRSLPPAQQRELRQKLRYFASLPPAEQQHVLQLLDRMQERKKKFGDLPPPLQQRALWVHNQMLQLPPDRRLMVKNEIHDLRAMPPEQRQQRIDSDRDKGMFSPHERDILREVIRLPLAPAQNGAAPAPPA